ncbi:ABC-type glycerol-3-phosphate transport system substrate-binding protein [Evansella vedderi]|uniref:ABC-type glycerol-3-phosphate transport system substrate-binding protein n=1 Tax=Evansella vedderi TaxID=38282 RepID=A0ABT9ZPR2_9BACI|nr:extracellular solute-binding protein [Evansella vedderi]MDQ0253229.1 ABC-type glycerol-3-phosphate transport system substrate-binding protein [Evansella vedderi]
MKRNLVFLLLCVLFLVLAACSSDSASEAPIDDGTTEEADVTTEDGTTEETGDDAETEEAAYYQTPEMDFDLGGKTIKVVSWWDMTIGEDNPDSIQRKENLEALMEKHNFEIEYIAIDFGEYQERVTASLLAGDPLGDIIRLGRNYTIPTLVQQDLLWPIDEYTQNPNAFNQLMTNELFVHEGRGYGFTEDQTNLIQGIFYNRTLMNELGMKPLQEYVNEDNWNWDTFIEVAKEANQDTNNDGRVNTWGLARPSVLLYALFSNNTSLTVGDQQNLDDPATVEALNFVSQIATEEIARPTEGGDWTEPGQFFRQGNTLMYPGAYYEIGGLNNDMPDYDIGFIPFPKGPSATTYHSAEPALQALAIPRTVENPEQLLYIWEKINDIDSIYDYPGQASFETNFSNQDDIDNLLLVQPNLVVLAHDTFPNFGYWDFEAELLSGNSVSTVIETFSTQFQAAIDEVYGSN